KSAFAARCRRRRAIWFFASTWRPRIRGRKILSPWAKSKSTSSIRRAARSPRNPSPSCSSSFRPKWFSSGSSPSITTTTRCSPKSRRKPCAAGRRRSKPVSNPPPYRIPIVDLRAQYAAIRDEVRTVVDAVNESQQFILGPAVKQFEEQMAAYLHCRFAVGVASGSDALLLALMALGVGAGDAVITTPFTFFSTVSSITRLGARPLFVDIDAESFLLPADGVEKLLAERARSSAGRAIDAKTGLAIRALLPVHLFGRICAMRELTALARDHGLAIVEDVAQACGARVSIAGQTK